MGETDSSSLTSGNNQISNKLLLGIEHENDSTDDNNNEFSSLEEDGDEEEERGKDKESSVQDIVLFKCRAFFVRTLCVPLLDETGDLRSVITGTLVIIGLGVLLGLVMPKNEDFNSTWYPYVSSVFGYTSLIAWTARFYPQIFLNYRRKETSGLSLDSVTLDVFCSLCYTVINSCFFWSDSIQNDYMDLHDGDKNMVQFNDVIYGIYSFVLSAITLSQIYYYDNYKEMRISRFLKSSLWLSLALCMTFIVVIFLHQLGILAPSENDDTTWLQWINFLYLLSVVNIFMSVITAIPQVLLNARRQSTVGWNIWDPILEFIGAVACILQLIFDCWNEGHWTGITGDPVKFYLSVVAIIFDVIFMVQHYILFPQTNEESDLSENASVGEHEWEYQQIPSSTPLIV